MHQPASLEAQSEPIRLRTLVMLRWVALSGQLCAIVAAIWLGLRFEVIPVLIAVAAGAAFNLHVTRWGARSDGRHVVLQLTFDIAQVSALLAMTGGLSNPFALLILAPVTIAATALDRGRVVVLGLATMTMVTVIGLFAWPLRDSRGQIVDMPVLLLSGHWFAIIIGVAFFAAYAHKVAGELRARSNALAATEMALAREQKLQHLGGVVAAAAHEMGTPLATIKLVSSELADELADHPELAEDLVLLRESADRCRDILRSMGRAGKDDVMLHAAPLATLIAEAAEPHEGRCEIRVRIQGDEGGGEEPLVRRDAAVMYGLRNLIQNAVDFADSTVEIDARWSETTISVTIRDDGPGFAPALMARIGEPFLTTRRQPQERDGYEGMGLGLFIAKTLLERADASLQFENANPGARVTVTWLRPRLEVEIRGPLGDNPAIA